jgi:hypothetical protein
VIGLVVVFFSLNSIVKKGVETVGPKLTKVEVRLGNAKLSPLSGKGRLSDLFVGNPEGYQTPSAIKLGDIALAVEPGSLLSDTLVVDEINIQAPEITFEGTLSGNNLSKILQNLEAAAGGESPDKAAKPDSTKPGKKFFVKDFVLKGGKITAAVSTPLGSKSGTLALPEVHLQNIGSRENGVTAAELAKQMMKAIEKVATEAVATGIADIGKGLEGLGKGSTGQVDKATQTLKNLFKK